MFFSVYRGFRLLWIPVKITLIFLLDGTKALPGINRWVSDYSTDDRANEAYPPVNVTRQRNDCKRYERVFRLKITVASTQSIVRSGEGEKNLLCDPKYELRLGRREKKGEDIIIV